MQDRPHVSQFNLHPDLPQPPHIPSLIRSRHRHHQQSRFSDASPQSSLKPKEIIIEVQTPVQRHSKQSLGIRAHIDACLQAIQKSTWNVKHRYLSKYSPGQTAATQQGKKHQTNKIQVNEQSPSKQRDLSIHRIDNRLILDYLSTVGRDYRLRDPFEPKKNLHCQTPPNYSKHSSSIEVRHKKKYINITQTSKIDKRSDSSYKKQRVIPRSEEPKVQRIEMAPREQRMDWKNRQNKGLRYCINCEKAVWSGEIDIHQQQCTNFSHLYILSFEQLSQLVFGKISRMSKELRQRIGWLHQTKEGLPRIDIINKVTLQKLKNYLQVLQKNIGNQCQQYGYFKESIENPYMQAIEMTHRLHWFTRVASQLQSQSQTQKKQRASIFLREVASGKYQAYPRLSPIQQLRDYPRHLQGSEKTIF